MSDRSEDEIAVSPVMAAAGMLAMEEAVKMPYSKQASHIYRAMERVRRAEADAEVIRRSVLPS